MDSNSINNTVTNSQVVDFLNRCDESSFILSTTSETSNALTVNPEQLPSCSRVPTVAAANVEYPEKNTVTESSESTKNKKFSHYSVVPMLIEDIEQITTEYSGLKRFHKIFGKSFGSIMIYGMICEVKLLNTSGSKELISSLKVADGTGIINVRYKHNAGVGKTSVVMRYVCKSPTRDISPTIGASFFTCKVNVDDIKVKMQVWDTAGQERFKAMAPLYYRNANAALLIFDLSSYNTFNEIKIWVQELQKNVQEPIVLTLVGNKSDLYEKRTVTHEEAFLFATSIGGNYFETSVIEDQGIDQIFITTALGLIRLSDNQSCSSIKRYESVDSISKSYSNLASAVSNENLSNSSVIHLGEGLETEVEPNGIGRLEQASWSIDHIAHGDEHKIGYCCF